MKPSCDDRLVLFFRNFFLFIIFALHFSCVSVQLGNKSGVKSKNAVFNPPESPFKSIDNEKADNSWKSSSTGNTISVYTECNENPEPLEKFELDSLAALKNAEIQEAKLISFNDREARSAKVVGTLEGISLQMQLVSFRKKGCDYFISFVGRKDQINRDQNTFQKFLSSFRVP